MSSRSLRSSVKSPKRTPSSTWRDSVEPARKSIKTSGRKYAYAGSDSREQSESAEIIDEPARRTHPIIKESIGDLFASPPTSVLIHACNCQGSWGAGIAAAFRSHYPSAFEVYRAHCEHRGRDSLGTCLLIPPQLNSDHRKESESKHWIACLFTSVGKGKGKGSKQSILDATSSSVEDLFKQLRQFEDCKVPRKESEVAAVDVGELKMCKINSGLFGVPWERTKSVVEGLEIAEHAAPIIEVISREA